MKNGLAIWHYPHRTVEENVYFFKEMGFESVSLHGFEMYDACKDEEKSKELAIAVEETGVILTVHGRMPESHSEEDVKNFINCVDATADWQEKYGLIDVLSFDVPQKIRDNATEYIEYVLKYEQFGKVAVEDFGLTKEEKSQIEHLKENKRFGYLVDVGHMYIRMKGENKSGASLFTNHPEECPLTSSPCYDDFMKAFATKEFPIFEIHLHNNNGVDDLHYFFDDGTLDIQTVAKVIKDINYNGVLTNESAPGYKFKCEYPESDIRIKETFEYWKSLI